MSSKINSKDIIIKQKEKVSSLDWSNFLQSQFDKKEFDAYISFLINQLDKGVTFKPTMGAWFNDFTSVSLADLNVVVICEQVEDLESTFLTDLDRVMIYPLRRTTSSDGTSHLDKWRLFNIDFIDYLVSNKENLVYVFVGFEASQYADLITEDSQGYKIFLPEGGNELFQTAELKKLFEQNVNNLLIKHDISPILW